MLNNLLLNALYLTPAIFMIVLMNFNGSKPWLRRKKWGFMELAFFKLFYQLLMLY